MQMFWNFTQNPDPSAGLRGFATLRQEIFATPDFPKIFLLALLEY